MGIYSVQGSALAAPYSLQSDVLNAAYDKDANVIFTLGGQRVLLFEDDFDTFDSSMWSCEIGDVRNQDSNLQMYRAENVTIENSCLVLTAKRENYAGKAWTSGSISGQQKQRFKYGRFEARIKFPNISGAFAAFWMVGSNFWKEYVDGGRPTNHGEIWPKCGEIDITETIPGTIQTARCNMWSYTGSSFGTANSGAIDPTSFNIYAAEWTEQYVAISVNGTEFKRYTFSDYGDSATQAYHLPFYMILNLAVGSQGGTVAEETTEMKMYVDWVRVYSPLVS
jgi:beta-glucanase (GH16 family)